MGWITAITNFFGLLNKLLVFIKERQLREDERNKIKVEQDEALQEKKKIADAIDASNPDDDFLLPPEKRSKRL
jgi:hypothetical protein